MENLKLKAVLPVGTQIYIFKKPTNGSELHYYFCFYINFCSIKEKRVQGLTLYSINIVLAHYTHKHTVVKNQPIKQKKPFPHSI